VGLTFNWERKILRKGYGLMYKNGSWRMKMNQEIYNVFKSPYIVNVIRVYIFEWLGYVVRMNDKMIVKKVLKSKPGGGRKKEELD
jgi:hypothetical protein